MRRQEIPFNVHGVSFWRRKVVKNIVAVLRLVKNRTDDQVRAAVCCNVLHCVRQGYCRRVAVCCSVLQCVAVCRNVLQCVALCSSRVLSSCCSVLQCVAVCRSVLQCVALCSSRVLSLSSGNSKFAPMTRCTCCSVLQCGRHVYCRRVAGCCSVLQYVAVCCSVLQCVAAWP